LWKYNDIIFYFILTKDTKGLTAKQITYFFCMTWNKEDCRLVLLYVGHLKGVTPFKTHFHAFFKTPSSNIFLRTGLFVCSQENGKTTGCQLCEGWMWIPSFCFLFWFQLKEVKAFWSDILNFSSLLSIFFTQERLL